MADMFLHYSKHDHCLHRQHSMGNSSSGAARVYTGDIQVLYKVLVTCVLEALGVVYWLDLCLCVSMRENKFESIEVHLGSRWGVGGSRVYCE